MMAQADWDLGVQKNLLPTSGVYESAGSVALLNAPHPLSLRRAHQGYEAQVT